MRIKLTNSIFFYLVGVRKYKQKSNSLQLRSTTSPRSQTQSNHHGTECSNLLVHSSTANARLAGYITLFTNIISSYEKTEQFNAFSKRA